MPKLFCVSDIHGYYDQFISALDKAGFDKDNPDHILISLGDHFDRGHMPFEVMRFLNSLPRKVLIKGNHEQLLVECCEKGYPDMHDFTNGTVTTIHAFGGVDEDFYEASDKTLRIAKRFFSEMVNYFETENYIFVHSWIPTINKDGLPSHYIYNRTFEFDPNWRSASRDDWDVELVKKFIEKYFRL